MDHIQTVDLISENNGITMRLSSYLADGNGIVPELVFTRNDGSAFASDTKAVGSANSVDVRINNSESFATQNDYISMDGMLYYCLPIVHFNNEYVNSIPMEINVSKLIYNAEEMFETAGFDLYGSYNTAEINTLEINSYDDLSKLFDNIHDNPVQTEIGASIYSVVFAKVKFAPPPEGVSEETSADGIDLGALSYSEYSNIVGIKYTRKLVENDKEYVFRPRYLHGNPDKFFGVGIGIDEETAYHFFRVADFENLADMGGIDFIIENNNFIEGDWHIETQFTSSQEQSVAIINKLIETRNPNTTFALAEAGISLFSVTLTYEVRDSERNLLPSISGSDLNDYYFLARKSILANRKQRD